MKRGPVTLALIFVGLILARNRIEPRVLAGDAPEPGTVRIGLVNSIFRDVPEPLVQVMAAPFKSLMVDRAGVVGHVVVDGDGESLAVQLRDGKVDLGVFNGFEFAWARLKNPDLKPLMIAVNHQPFLHAVVVVRDDIKADGPAELQGKIMALPRLAREHCRVFLERRCVQHGTPMEKWFAKVLSPRTDHDALDDVAENVAQAAVVDDVEWAAYRKKFPRTAARLRVLLESETFPCAVIAYQPGGLDLALLDRLRAGMIAAKKTERGRKLMELCRITGFEAVPAEYEQNLIDIRKAYPPREK
jgi:ABC-type phosphate/phosphonate transport system substrate-binding protein